MATKEAKKAPVTKINAETVFTVEACKVNGGAPDGYKTYKTADGRKAVSFVTLRTPAYAGVVEGKKVSLRLTLTPTRWNNLVSKGVNASSLIKFVVPSGEIYNLRPATDGDGNPIKDAKGVAVYEAAVGTKSEDPSKPAFKFTKVVDMDDGIEGLGAGEADEGIKFAIWDETEYRQSLKAAKSTPAKGGEVIEEE